MIPRQTKKQNSKRKEEESTEVKMVRDVASNEGNENFNAFI